MANHDAGSFLFTLTNYGQFGGGIGPNLAGDGLRYPKDAPYKILHRGALLVGTSSLRVSDGIKGLDWAPAPGGPIQETENSPRADQVTVSYTAEKSARDDQRDRDQPQADHHGLARRSGQRLRDNRVRDL